MSNLPGYDIITCIYESAKTEVSRALRLHDQQPVILKQLKNPYPNTVERQRFQHSYELAQQLQLPALVAAYELIITPQRLIMVLEDFGGQALKHWLTTRTFSVAQKLNLSLAITSALAELHAANVIHKNLNSHHIIYNPNTGQLKLTDLSIATTFIREAPSLHSSDLLEGTLAYIAPEQTGRINLPLDYRTDFYSLGVTLFELFSGQLPFTSQDALELIHCHIARQPPALTELAPENPAMIGHIINKLLAKSPAHRYQSAWGLRADCLHCQQQWQKNHHIQIFTLAQQDIAETFQLPNQLYERQWAINHLLKAIDRTQQDSRSEFILVTGAEGVGKTALMQTVFNQAIASKKGYFINSHFDHFHNEIPYHGLTQAIKELIQQLLTENETQLQAIAQRLQKNLGNNAAVMLSIIPELAVVLTAQAPPLPLTGVAAFNRLQLTWINTLQAFAQPDRPLVLFLDDIQLIDSASLQLLTALLTQVPHLLVIAAYQDQPASQGVALTRTLREAEIALSTISLQPLSLHYIQHYLANMLHCPTTEVISLAELVLNKTNGNPFFIGEFLKNLYQSQHLSFNQSKRCWQWQLAAIKNHPMTDNVAVLLTQEIKQLPAFSQHLLQFAACFGQQFNLSLLAELAELELDKIKEALQIAVTHQLLLPVASTTTANTLHETHGPQLHEYRFAHERIQKAAYALLSTSQQRKLHEAIGQLRLKQASHSASTDQLFAVVNQLNLGEWQQKNQAELDQLATLNLTAGQHALSNAAYEAALRYFNTGLARLGEHAWQRNYTLWLALTVFTAEAYCLAGQFAKTMELTATVLTHAHSLLDRIRAYEIEIQAYKAQNNPQQAVHLGLTVLAQLGIHFPRRPHRWSQVWNIILTQMALMGRPVDELAQLPPMLIAEKQAAMRLLLSISPAIYAVRPRLLPLVTCKRVRLSIAYGNALESMPAYASYGYLLCEQGHIETGYLFAQLALQLQAKQTTPILKARVLQIVYGVIAHYKQSLHSTLPPLKEAYHSGLETGNFEYAMVSAATWIMHAFFAGNPLDSLVNEILNYSKVQNQIKHYTQLHHNYLYLQTAFNLLGRTESSNSIEALTQLEGDYYRESALLAQHHAEGARGLVFQVYLQKLILACIFHQEQAAIEYAQQAAQHLDAVIGSLLIPTFYFYDSLAHLGYARSAEAEQRPVLLKKVMHNQRKLQPYTRHAAMNYQHKYSLIAAEYAYLTAEYAQARELYDVAIQHALTHEFLAEVALSQERAGQFYLARQMPKLAQLYLTDALHSYRRWGAHAKITQMEAHYSHLLIHPAWQQFNTVSELTLYNSRADLELASILKAAQVFAGEIVLERLLTKMMNITLEHAGAQRGLLILHRQGQWYIEAEQDLECNQMVMLKSIPLDSSHALSVGIVYYVARTCQALVLSDALHSPRFANDEYIIKQQPKSVLCVPLLHQGQLTGLLYLENNLAMGVFTTNRLNLINLLSTQMAIAIENARLYADLESKVKTRTHALEAKNQQLTYFNQEKNALLNMIANDLKDPLAHIQALAEIDKSNSSSLTVRALIERLHQIQENAQKIFVLIKNLLVMNKIALGELTTQPKIFDLLPVIKTLLNAYQVPAQAKGIRLQLMPEQHTYYPVYADAAIVYQVLDNLLSNALKYAPLHSVIQLHLQSQAEYLECHIQDQRPAIKATEHARLLDKFSDLTTQASQVETSTDLELFIVKKLVSLVQGHIWCNNDVDQGTCFVVALPLVEQDGQAMVS